MELIKKEIIDNRVHLVPKDGYYITDGKETFAKYLILAEGLTDEGYYAIPDEEYQRIMAEREEAIKSLIYN